MCTIHHMKILCQHDRGLTTLRQGVHRAGPSTLQPRGQAGQLSPEAVRPDSTNGHAQ